MDLVISPRSDAIAAIGRAGHFVTEFGPTAVMSRFARVAAALALVLAISACSMFGPAKIKEEAIVPADTLYQTALTEMDRQNYNKAIENLKKLERQHPYSEYNEKAKLMEVYANYRIGKFPEAILAADRFRRCSRLRPKFPMCCSSRAQPISRRSRTSRVTSSCRAMPSTPTPS